MSPEWREFHTKTQLVLDPAFNHRQLPELVSWTMVCRPRPTDTHDSGSEQRERQPAAHICNMVCIGHVGISPGKQTTEALKGEVKAKIKISPVQL